MVDMHDIVAHLKLLEFLEGECHLPTPCLVGTERITVEAVEDLMVGEDTALQVVVNETGMEGGGDVVER